MRTVVKILALAVFFIIQLMLALKPVIELMEKNAVMGSLRIPLILVLWVIMAVLLYRMMRSTLVSLGTKQSSSFEQALSSFVNAMINFAAGNLTTGIPVESITEDITGMPGGINESGKLLLQGVDEFNAITATPLKRLCFVGDNSFHEGLLVGEQICKRLSKGTLLVVIPFFSQVLHALRAKGCISFLQQHCKGMTILPVVEGFGNGPRAVETVKKAFEKEPGISCIYFTDGVSPYDVVHWLKENRPGGRVCTFGHDITDKNMELLNKNMLECILAENFYAQTYNAIMHLYNSLETGWKPVSRKLYLDPLQVSRQNCMQFWDSQKNERILTGDEMAVLVEPAENKSGKKWHIAAVLPTATSFFVMGAKGAEDAKKRLSALGVTVDVIDSFKNWNNFATRAVMEPPIRMAMQKGVQGISTAVFDRNLVPVINEAVESGIIVTTFNSEPLNLRDIILNVGENIESLQKSSSDLASSAEESSRANEQIVKGMNSIEQSTGVQNENLEKTEVNFSSLNDVIGNLSSIVDTYSQSVERVNQEIVRGVEQISESDESFQSLKESLRKIFKQLNQLQEDMGRVGKIVSTIESFSTDTNVLAINASIQAARAGEQGKAFAVVAKEIRTLSEKSALATEEIAHIISATIEGVAGVVEFSSNNLKMVEQDSRRLSQVNSAFKNVRSHVDESNESIKGIHQSVSTIASSSSSLKKAMDMVFNMNKENLQSVQEISVSLRELATQGAELSRMASRYLDMANSQEKVISQLTF